MSKRARPSLRLLALTLAVGVAAAGGCTLTKLRAAERAREDYERCVERNGAEASVCQVLKAEYERKAADYEASTREWRACDPERGECTNTAPPREYERGR